MPAAGASQQAGCCNVSSATPICLQRCLFVRSASVQLQLAWSPAQPHLLQQYMTAYCASAEHGLMQMVLLLLLLLLFLSRAGAAHHRRV
jgi:hypothetical protein